MEGNYRAPLREFALREDPSRRTSEVVLVLACVASLGAVLQVLLSAGRHAIIPVVLSVVVGDIAEAPSGCPTISAAVPPRQ